MYIACSEGYGAFCRAVKMLFLEVVSVLCFGQGSYESPTPELIEVLMKQIFKADQVTQDLTPLAWEEADSNPVVRSVLLQLILMGRCVAFYSYCKCFQHFMLPHFNCCLLIFFSILHNSRKCFFS